MTRWRAAGMHLLISAGVTAAVLALMLAVWYPPPLFEASGGSDLALILAGVQVVGPMLTLIVFKAGKRGMKFDLAAIALFQLVALLYGCHVIYLARPAFIVFVKDQFELATAVELEPERLAAARYPQFRKAPWSGPVLVAGGWPADSAEQQMLLEAALAGQDLQHFPKYYRPYSQGRSEILAKAQPIAHVRVNEPTAGKVVDDWLARSGNREEDVRYLRLRARHAWVALLIDHRTAAPVKMLLAEKL